MSDESERARERLMKDLQDKHWNCPLCGEGYPSRENAGVSEELERKVVAAIRDDAPPKPYLGIPSGGAA